MRPIVKIFIVAVVLLILKAFLLDDYIAKHYGNDANATVENNISAQASATPALQEHSAPVEKMAPKESNVSAMAPEKQEKTTNSEDKKMPLDRLGDKISEHIKL